MQVLCLEDVLKSHCCLRHQTELSFCQNMEGLIQSGSAELWWSDESIFQLHADLQRGVFKDLVRNIIVNAPQFSMEESCSWCGESFQLLVLVSCFTMKSQLMLWNTG